MKQKTVPIKSVKNAAALTPSVLLFIKFSLIWNRYFTRLLPALMYAARSISEIPNQNFVGMPNCVSKVAARMNTASIELMTILVERRQLWLG